MSTFPYVDISHKKIWRPKREFTVPEAAGGGQRDSDLPLL